jgi:YHS domain-containing protein
MQQAEITAHASGGRAALEKDMDNKRKVARRAWAAVAVWSIALGAFIPSVWADEFVNTGYFGDVAIKGYDPVAYFTEHKAIEGSEAYSHRWLGATWHFASPENRDLFIKDPVKYAPQYGGLCADGVSFGTITTNIDPEAWRIIEGKLYLSYDPGAASGFEKTPSKVVDSQKYWPEVEKTIVARKAEEGTR